MFIRIHSLDSNNVKKKEHQPWGENATIKYVTVKNTESTNMGLQERGGYTILRKRTPKIHTLSNIDTLEKKLLSILFVHPPYSECFTCF